MMETNRRGFIGSFLALFAAGPGAVSQGGIPPSAVVAGSSAFAGELKRARRALAISSLWPEWRVREVRNEATYNVANGRALTDCPAPHGAPAWLRRKMHIEAECKYLRRRHEDEASTWLERLLFKKKHDMIDENGFETYY